MSITTFQPSARQYTKVLYVDSVQQATVGTSEESLSSKALDAGELGTDNDTIQVEAWGTLAANGDTKVVILKFGATNLISKSSTINNKGWWISGIVTRRSATTQTAIAHMVTAAGINTDPVFTTPGETLSGSITVDLRANGTNIGDIILEGMTIVKYSAP